MLMTRYDLFLDELRKVNFQLDMLKHWFVSEGVFEVYDSKTGKSGVTSGDMKIIKSFDACRCLLFDEIYLPVKESIENSGY